MSLRSDIKVRLAVQILAFACVTLAFSLLIIKDFSVPLSGGGDIEQWEYTGFYVAKNLRFAPFPQLDLVNNLAFYPYGTNGVFQPWSIERDILYAIFYSFFGFGPWLQFYYLFSVLLTAIGTFTLLVRDYGFARASGAGFLISFFSFYAIHKYPAHLGYAVFHWTALSLIADFLIVKRVTLRKHVALRLILLRICLLILSLGQELGYIAGFALMSFTVSIIFIIVILVYRYFTRRQQKLGGLFQSTLKIYKNEFVAYPRISLALIGLSVVTSYINLPLVIQISSEAKSFDFTGIPSGAWWTNPLRLLIPFLPGFNPGQVVFEQLLKDAPEGLGAGSPSWFLLIIGTVGLWKARKQITIFIPLIIIFFLCLLYDPANFPTLHIFPWFTFNRVAGRCTVIYPVILCLFALHINFNGLRLRSRQLISALLVFLACTELYTAYSLKSYQPYTFDKNFFTYMSYVKQQPGEAVLDWPFCASGGNAVGLYNLCPYFFKNAAIYALRRFHEKKVMGQYFGRLHTSQIQPYLQAGWDNLFIPDSPDIFKATRQARCFRPEEWSFFTSFYNLNDFAGINLYVDLLPLNCVNQFYAHFGTPSMETEVPWAGKVKFITKSPQLRNQVNLTSGANLKFKPFLNIAEADLLRVRSPYGLTVAGLSEIEKNAEGSIWRWALGPETRLTFQMPRTQSLAVVFSFLNSISGQDVVVEANGVTVKIADINQDTIKRRLEFQGIEGLNTIVFKYKNWNKNPVAFAPNDPRPMAIQFTQLTIEEK